MKSIISITFLLSLLGAEAWNIPTPSTTSTASRRDMLIGTSKNLMVLIGGTSAATMAGFPSPALADISDGNVLPKGALQFSRVIKSRSDLVSIYARVSRQASEMDKKEWDNVAQFLRKLYAVGDDMKDIANGLPDPAKRKRGLQLVDDIKKFSKAADAPTGTQNAQEFLQFDQKLVSILDEFMGLLQDVPDEL